MSSYEHVCRGNGSAGNSTSDIWMLEDSVTGQVTAAFLLLIILMGLPMNLLVVFTILKKKLYHQPTIALLLLLAVNDIIVLVLELPARVVTGFAGEFIHGGTDAVRCVWCAVGVVTVISSFVCLHIITVMSVDRFLYMYKPLHYEKILTSWRVVLVVFLLAGSFTLAVILTLVLDDDSVIDYHPQFLACVVDFSNLSVLLLVIVLIFSLIPVLILIFFNGWLGVIVWKNIRAIYNVSDTLNAGGESKAGRNAELYKSIKKKKKQKELHLIQVFVALLGSSLLFWTPIIILSIYFLATGGRPQGPLTSAIFVIFISQVAAYPMIETFLIKDVREPFKKWLLCLCLRKKRADLVGKDSSDSCCSNAACGKFNDFVYAAFLGHFSHTVHSELDQNQSQENNLKMASIS